MKRACLYAILAGAVTLQACGSARRGEPIAGPLEISSQKAANGQLVFMRNCNQCHPWGEAGVGPALNNKPLPAFLIKIQVRKGIGAMPSFPKEHISDSDLEDLILYIKTLRHHGKGGRQ